MRSATLAVCLTGSLAVAIPAGLLLGKDGLVAAGVNRQAPIPAPRMLGCHTGRPVEARQLRPGQCTKLTGHGFNPRELILVTESRRPGWQTYLRADAMGGFSYHYLVSATAAAGVDVLAFIGLEHSGPSAVPPVAFCRFTVAAD